MLRTFDLPISWRDLLMRTGRAAIADNVMGLSAQLAFYFFLALFPALLVLIALASFFPLDLMQQMVTTLGTIAPQEVTEIVSAQVSQIAESEDTGLLTFGILVTLWSSSAAMVGVIDAMNQAYDIEEGRPWWKVRLTAIGLTVGLALFVLLAFTLVLLGPTLAGWLARHFGFGAVFTTTWQLVQWPLAVVLVAGAVGIVNYFGPDAEQDWEWITPGAALATVLWLVASLGFKLYVSNFTSYNESYGTIGGVIVLLLRFYVTGMALLVGAEMNATIEHASPHGKDVGEKVPGEKRRLGAAAARAHAARGAGRRPAPLSRPDPVAQPPAPR